MSENIERLRKAIREERDNSGSYESEDGLATWLAAAGVTDAALAAVEQEMAKLARSEAYLTERVEALEAQQTQRAQEMAALEAERDELRKRPTLEKALYALNVAWDEWSRTLIGTDDDESMEPVTISAIRALYAEKAQP